MNFWKIVKQIDLQAPTYFKKIRLKSALSIENRIKLTSIKNFTSGFQLSSELIVNCLNSWPIKEKKKDRERSGFDASLEVAELLIGGYQFALDD